MRRRYRSGRPGAAPKLLIVLLAAVLLVGGVLFYASHTVRPYLQTMAEARAQTLAALAVSHAVEQELSAEEITYDDLVSFEKDNNGRINAVKTNTVKLNQLRAALSDSILEYMGQKDNSEVSIPMGNLINGDLFSGRGPNLVFRLVPVGSVGTDMENVFTSAGINQTRHQILLRVHVKVEVLLPVTTAFAEVDTSVCIAETVIVGDVPESFTNVENDPRSTLDKINDYTGK